MSAGPQFNVYVGAVDLGKMQGANGEDGFHTPELVLFNRVYGSGTVRVTGHLRDGFVAPDHGPSESVPTRILSGLILDEDEAERGGAPCP